MKPNDKDAREKYEQTLKEHRLRQFQSCLGYNEDKVKIDIDGILVEDSYLGPKLEKSTDEIDTEWMKTLMKW